MPLYLLQVLLVMLVVLSVIVFAVGFAGNAGGTECACGETNRCDGGAQDSCNTDLLDDNTHIDRGIFIDKSQLPVSRICMGGVTSMLTRAEYNLGQFVCAPEQFG